MMVQEILREKTGEASESRMRCSISKMLWVSFNPDNAFGFVVRVENAKNQVFSE